MLTTIREKTQGIIAAIIIGVIILVFALWGVNSYFSGGADPVVASGGGVEIKQRTYRNALEQARGRVPQELLDSPFYKESVAQQLLLDTVESIYLDNLGYTISDATLSKQIRALPYFQKNNTFDPDLYSMTLRSQQLTPPQFEARLRADMVAEQLKGGLSNSAFLLDAETDALLQVMLQKRTVDYVIIDPDRYARKSNITEEEIKKYYETNNQRFMSPDQVQIEYLVLSAKELISDFRPTEEELKAAYDAGGGFVTPEKRWASHILIELSRNASPEQESAARQKIAELQKKLKAGASFASLAREYSADKGSAPRGGDLGEVKPGGMVKEFEQALNELNKEGEVSQPVRTQFGFHLIKMTRYEKETRKPYKEVKRELEKRLKKEYGEKRFFDLSSEFHNLVYEQPDSLNPAAEALGLKPKKSAWFSRKGGLGIAAKPAVVSAAFNPEVLEQGRNSEVIEIDETTLVSIRLLERKKPSVKSLSEVRAEIVDEIKKQKGMAQAAEVKTRVLADMKSGLSVAKVAGREGLEFEQARVVVRGDNKENNPQLIENVFAAGRPESGGIIREVSLGNKGFAVYRLTAVTEGNPGKATEKEREEVRNLLDQRYGKGVYAGIREGFRLAADVKVFKDNL